MPTKVPGRHNLHVKIDEQSFRTLQKYCSGGVERISASAIINLFLKHYIEDFLKPRLEAGESAAWAALQQDLPKATALVAHRIEPNAFEAPDD